MADEYIVQKETLSGIADAIREKTGKTDEIPVPNMKSEILAIPVGSDVSGVTAEAGDVLSGKVIVGADGNHITGTMTNNGAVNGTISTKAGLYTIPEGYHNGSGKVAISSTEQAKIISENIKSGVSILGVSGSVEDVNLDSELSEQDSLISQIRSALDGKAAGGSGSFETTTVEVSTSGKILYMATTIVAEGALKEMSAEMSISNLTFTNALKGGLFVAVLDTASASWSKGIDVSTMGLFVAGDYFVFTAQTM